MPSPIAPAVVWFRDDLRLVDQPALDAAARSGRPVIALYIFDNGRSSGRPLGGASRWWLHYSLQKLAAALQAIGGRLDIIEGEHADAPRVIEALGAAVVYWTRRYTGAEIEVDKQVKASLSDAGVETHSFNGFLLREPWEVQSKAGAPMRVFSPFWRAHQALGDVAAPLPAPKKLDAADWPAKAPKRVALDDLALLPTSPDWAGGLRETWTPGEAGAEALLDDFLDERLKTYANDRDRPDREATSRLSPHLKFGEISVRRIVHAVRHAEASHPELMRPATKFVSELGWREFSYHLLYNHPDLATRNFTPRFDAFPWRETDPAVLRAWKFGNTGYPIVDAGMRELRATGFMHNRVRMIVASFLIKHLLIDWRVGERWFWDNLCDADPANNAASWQWVAGSGADAAPYFRIFNPIIQGEKFDPRGEYVRRWVPELADVPDEVVHKPWMAKTAVANYAPPLVEHSAARQRALDALASLGEANAQSNVDG